MKKLEIIYRDILQSFFTDRSIVFQQKDLAHKFHFSLSTVFHALQDPRRTGAIKVTGRNFVLTDAEKLLVFWATHRRLDRETLYRNSGN